MTKALVIADDITDATGDIIEATKGWADIIETTEAWANHASQIRNLAMALQVTTAEEYQIADGNIEKIAGRKKKWEAEYKEAREVFRPAQEALTLASKAIKSLDEASKIVKSSMRKYREDDQIRIEEEERKIRKAAELEKREKEEAARLKREAAETERLKAVAAAAKKEEDSEHQAAAEEQVLAAQEKVAAAEREEEATKQLALPAVKVKSEVPQVENTTTSHTWKARVVDVEKISRFFLICEPNMAKLNEYAREHKDKARVPGVEFYEHETVVRVGSRGKM